MLWHSKILIWFFITNLLLDLRRVLKFSSKELSLSKNFFCDKYFVWIHPRLDYWSWRFFISFWLKGFSFGKNIFFLKNLLNSPMAFWSDLLPFSKIPLAMTQVKIHSQEPFLIFGSWYTSNPASWTSPWFFFHLFLIKNNFCPLLWLLEIYKGATLSTLSSASKPISLASP